MCRSWPALQKLDLHHTDCTDDDIVAVARHCPRVTTLAIKYGCGKLTVPEAQRRNTPAILQYYKALRDKAVTSTVVKAVFMGEGMAGKTSLFRALATLRRGDDEDDRSAAAAAIRYAPCHQPHLYAKKKLSKMEKSNTKKRQLP